MNDRFSCAAHRRGVHGGRRGTLASSAVWFWLLLAAAVLGLATWRIAQRRAAQRSPGATAAAANRGSQLGWKVTDFTLTERSGQPLDTAALRGRPWVASFFFCGCPGPCIKVNRSIQRLISETPGSPVRFVSITVDPYNDTPQRMREYAEHFQADAQRWLFLTGQPEEVQRIATAVFHVSAATASHSERLIVVDGAGQIAGFFQSTDEADYRRLKQKLAELAEAKT